MNLGTGVSTASPIQVQYNHAANETRAWAQRVSTAGNAKSVTYTPGNAAGDTTTASKVLITSKILNAFNANNVSLMKNDGTAWALHEDYYNTDGLVTILQYTVDRNIGYGQSVSYNGGTITNVNYQEGGTDPTPAPNPDSGDTGNIVDNQSIRQELPATAKLQGMIDVHFVLSQFELMNKYQTNFNPDEFIKNTRVKKQTVKYKVGKNAKNSKKRIIKRTQRTLAPYDYNIWADAQYSKVSFTNGLWRQDAVDTSKRGSKQVLETNSVNGKVGIDFIASKFDGYARGYFGYNIINAKNAAFGNQYDGKSYEVGAQLMSGLDLLGVDFQGYADIGYAYNTIKVQTGVSDNASILEQNFDLDTNTHNIKAGLGVEKRFKIIGNADVGVGVDLDYVFSLGKEFKANVPYQNIPNTTEIGGEYVTPKQNHHYLITGAKAFAGYNIKQSDTYLYAQGTFGYQVLNQDEYINIDQVGGAGLKHKVKNASYQNHLATAGIGLSQKLAKNFNLHLQGTKLFSNNYTNDAFQVRGQVGYKW